MSDGTLQPILWQYVQRDPARPGYTGRWSKVHLSDNDGAYCLCGRTEPNEYAQVIVGPAALTMGVPCRRCFREGAA